MRQSLAVKYRPKIFEDVVGQDITSKILKRMVETRNFKNCYLFAGDSGCGKTTTLRIIGGFQTPKSGSVFFDGKDIADLPPYKREVNTVFQKYALFPNMNIAENHFLKFLLLV